MAAGERMATGDAAWLGMERATNLMVVTGLLWFERPLDWVRVRELVAVRLVDRYAAFRRRAVGSGVPLAGVRWEDDPGFELDRQLQQVALPAPGDEGALQKLVGDLMAVPLDRGRPLWRLHFVDGYGEGCAIVARIHQCLADPITLSRVLLSLTDERPDAPASEADEHAPRAARGPRPGGVGALVSRTRGVARGLIRQGRGIVTDPAKLVQWGSLARDDADALARLLTGRDPATVFKGKPGVARRVAWSTAIGLEQVKAIRRATATSVNDVLLAALAGALRRYLAERDSPAERLRAIVPFTLRPTDRPPPRRLGNSFGVVFLPLPVGHESAGERLAAVKREMDAIQRSPAEGAVAFGLLSATGRTLPELEKLVVDRLAARASAVMTNIPGPRHTVHLAGEPVRGLLFWAAWPGRVSLSVSIYSYAGEVNVGVATDAGLAPDPETIAAAIGEQLDELAAVTGPS